MVTSPHDWQEVQLREVLETDAIAITPEPNRLYAYFTVPGYDEKRFPYPEYGRNILSSKFVVNRRRLLICKINPRLSRIHFADYASDNPQICSTEFIPFKVDEESVNPEYVLFALKTPEASQFFQSRATGTSNSHKRMRPQDILDFPLPLPSLAEQKRIANILNHAEDLRI